jgi:hypothetical protein
MVAVVHEAKIDLIDEIVVLNTSKGAAGGS